MFSPFIGRGTQTYSYTDNYEAYYDDVYEDDGLAFYSAPVYEEEDSYEDDLQWRPADPVSVQFVVWGCERERGCTFKGGAHYIQA